VPYGQVDDLGKDDAGVPAAGVPACSFGFEEPVDGADGELAEPQVTDRRENVAAAAYPRSCSSIQAQTQDSG
jgi:hypothetical protein